MKTNKIFLLIIFILISLIHKISFAQEWQYTNLGFEGNNVQFLNANTGFIGLTVDVGGGNYNYVIKKTNDKGVSFNQIWSTPKTDDNYRGFNFQMLNETVGYVYVKSTLFRTSNGGGDWTLVHEFLLEQSYYQTMKFYNENKGFITFTAYPLNYEGHIEVWEITNNGHNYARKFLGTNDHKVPVISDITFSDNGNNLVMTGFWRDYFHSNYDRQYSLTSVSGGASFTELKEGYYGTTFDVVSYLPNSNSDYRIIGNRENGIGAPNTGVYCYNYVNASSEYKITGTNADVGGLIFTDANIGYAYVGDKIFKTTNSGQNWNDVYTCNPTVSTNRNSIKAFNDIIYSVDKLGNLLTHKLPTNLNSYIDNQLGSGFMIFDGISYTTSGISFLRGGNSTFSSSTINPNLSDEKIFYKWYDGYMGNSKPNYYLDMSGTTISNFYKTKQLSTSSKAIGYPSQSKSVRDTTVNNVTATHTIHESMGGIFYSKSTNYGASYQTEEVVNLSENSAAADGNKNAYLTVMRSFGGQYPITTSDADRNIAVVWEKYNSTTQMVEIKFAHRVLNIPQTGYEWKTYRDNSGNEYLTSFAASSGFESKPKCFVAVSPGQTQEGPFLIIVPHLRPNGSQNKIFTSVRYNSQSQDYELENGFIQDLAVTGPFNYYSSYIVHFAYLKDDKVAYRREEFGYYNGNIYRGTSPPPEVNNNISSGDGGFPSRYTPDISLMGGVPVITYSASYNVWRTIEYEDQSIGSIQVNRHPIVKVQRVASNNWTNFVIYNSGNNQSKPDIEGSTSTLSYILNYSIGNGSFKKIVNIPGNPGSMCQPNIFTGTDSRLINNSYTGSFGSNLSLLTLSPQSSLYKLDKQNFVITNITAQDAYDIDNLDGVVDLDTISYSFKVGPIYTQSFYENYYEIDGVGVIGPSYEEPVIGGIEFNENLKSYPFLLNETQALLIGSNASYVKDNNHYSISEIPYTVNLYNKTTGLLHRTLFQDTIKDQDSIETESLRGFYITDIPNGADSFYVKLEVDDEFDNADYFINPIYEDDYEGDNMSERKIAVIFENTNPSIHDNNIPVKYNLLQNYPNPFNPSTNLEFGISDLGFVSLKVYDILGKEVMTIVNEIKQPGIYKVEFDGSNLASGIYFYKIEAGSFVQTKRMILLK